LIVLLLRLYSARHYNKPFIFYWFEKAFFINGTMGRAG
jgi:hypothetical protein